MQIYVITKHDMDSSHVHSAYTDEFLVASKVAQLNAAELIKEQKYNEWVDNGGEGDPMPEWGDYTFTYKEIELIGVEK